MEKKWYRFLFEFELDGVFTSDYASSYQSDEDDAKEKAEQFLRLKYIHEKINILTIKRAKNEEI